MSSNNRRAPRVNCDIILNKVQDGHMHICRADNISLGGMRVQRLLEPLSGASDRVRLQFELPGDGQPIWVGAKRVYEDSDYFGFSFTHMSHQHFVRLRQWIQEAIEEDAMPTLRVTMQAAS